MLQRIFVFCLILLVAAGALAQAPSITNVRFAQKDAQIYIRYDLEGKPGRKYTVSAALSRDKGKKYDVELFSLEGDVGKDIKPGINKTITWNMLRDCPRGLEGEDFVFAVNAKLQKGAKKWPYLAGAAVAGGAAYFVLQSKGSEKDKGSVTIRVPGDL